MESKAVILFLVAMMLLTGVCNTLLTKYQDNQCVRNCDDPDPKQREYFEQPVYQTAQMFVGESGCWLVIGLMTLYKRWAERRQRARGGYEAVSTTEQAGEDGDAGDEDTGVVAAEPNGHAAAGAAADDDDDISPPLAAAFKASPASGGAQLLRGYGVLLLALPAICDILGTTLMNAGLLLVAASIYQMTRGALVLFVGLFSVLFLRRHLHLFQWMALVGVVAGVAVVGLAGAIYPDPKASMPGAGPLPGGGDDGSVEGRMMMLVLRRAVDEIGADALRATVGVLLIAGAQIFTATQFVLEEWILERSDIEPIVVVGWEGVFGFLVTIGGMIVLHFTIGTGYFDMVEGWRQMTENKVVLVTSILIMISIGGFNFFGLSVTRSVSATSRSTIDTCRTLFIWVVSLGLGWETFKWLQVVGFVLLVYSTFLFNGIVKPPFKFLRPREEVPELLPEEPIEHT